MSPSKTIFEKIIDREIPADIVYENEHCLAFHDIQPQAPVHVLVIPKRRIENVANLTDADQALAGKLLLAAGLLWFWLRRYAVHVSNDSVVNL